MVRGKEARLPSLNRSLIVRVALELIDETGIDALTLREVAQRLGVKAPSLYNHFHSKAELLEAVAEQLLRNTEYPGGIQDWRERIVAQSLGARRSLLGHPKAAPLLLRFFPRELLLKAYERSVGNLGAPAEFGLMILEAAEKLTFGSALFAAASIAEGKRAMPVFDAAVHPNLAGAIHASPSKDAEALFLATLRQFLDSIPDATVLAPSKAPRSAR